MEKTWNFLLNHGRIRESNHGNAHKHGIIRVFFNHGKSWKSYKHGIIIGIMENYLK